MCWCGVIHGGNVVIQESALDILLFFSIEHVVVLVNDS